MTGPGLLEAPDETLTDAAAQPAEPPIEWTVNPWRSDLKRVVLSVLTVVIMGGVLLQTGVHTTTSVVLWLVFMLTLSPGFSVLGCRVDGAGVSRRMLFVWDRRPWDRIRRAEVSQAALVVSPHRRPSALDTFRALHLPLHALPPDERQRLVVELRRRIRAHGL